MIGCFFSNQALLFRLHDAKVGEQYLVILREPRLQLLVIVPHSHLLELSRSMKLAHVSSFSLRHVAFLLTIVYSFSPINYIDFTKWKCETSHLRSPLVALWPLGRDGRAPLFGCSSSRSMTNDALSPPF
jgi:hypothetical protein